MATLTNIILSTSVIIRESESGVCDSLAILDPFDINC
jgi:hypothetical protein